MRLDKFLKVSRIIKRRSIAKEVADNQRININGIKVLELLDSTKKEDASNMFEIIEEKKL